MLHTLTLSTRSKGSLAQFISLREQPYSREQDPLNRVGSIIHDRRKACVPRNPIPLLSVLRKISGHIKWYNWSKLPASFYWPRSYVDRQPILHRITQAGILPGPAHFFHDQYPLHFNRAFARGPLAVFRVPVTCQMKEGVASSRPKYVHTYPRIWNRVGVEPGKKLGKYEVIYTLFQDCCAK